MKRKKALIVGINDYFDPISPLNGSIKDANDIAHLLSTSYAENKSTEESNFSCTMLTSNPDRNNPIITRARLKQELQLLFEDAEADVVLFYFSGHGLENSLGGYLVTQDASFYEEGVSFSDIITLANAAENKEVFIIIDCCHSGNLGDVAVSKNQFSYVREGISIMTASNARQFSIDTNYGGVFTQLICNALRGSNADLLGNVTFLNLYRHAESMLGAWEQRPTFKTNIKKSVVIRKVEPKIPHNVMRKVLVYFPTADHQFQLDPGFEPEAEPKDEFKEQQFSELQVLTNNGIVAPVDETYLYYAAMHSKSCKLTLLGKQYWLLMDAHRTSG